MSNKLNIPPLSQQDPLWNKKQLGTSNKTIGSHGCVITNITMMLRFLLGIKITPAELNDWLKANGGYHNANLFVWSILEKYDKRISFTDRDESAALGKIDAQLAKGLPVLVNVDMNPSTPALDEHWVLVKGKVAGSYIINDPWTGEEIEFEKLYGDPKTGVRIVCTYDFEGAPVPPTDPEPEPEVLFRVKVLINDLVIRSGAGKLYPVVYRYASGEYGILEVKKDAFSGAEYGRIGVNRWISLDPTYVRKLDSNTQSIEERITNLEARVTVLEKNK